MRFVDLALAAAVLLGADSTSGGYTAEQVRAAVEEHIRRTVRESGGVYRVPDESTGETLELEFVQASLISAAALWRVHDPDHRVDGRAYFACLLFHPIGAPEEKVYDVDVRVEPRDGALVVTDVRIHKEKQLVDGKWIWEPRPARPGGRSRSR